MKNFMKSIIVITSIILSTSSVLEAQLIDRGGKEIPEHLRFYKDKYEASFDAYFEDVWNAVVESIGDLNCLISQKSRKLNDEGLMKGIIRTDYCVFAQIESDHDVKDSLLIYSKKIPVILGASWSNGRMQYKIIIKETDDDKVVLIIKGEISGMESYITQEVHFWESSGFLEHHLMEAIKKKLKDK